MHLRKESGVEGLQRYCSARDIPLHPLGADDRDDFCDHLLQFRWIQDSSTVQNDVGVSGEKTIRTNVAVVGEPPTGKIRAA